MASSARAPGQLDPVESTHPRDQSLLLGLFPAKHAVGSPSLGRSVSGRVGATMAREARTVQMYFGVSAIVS